MTTQTDANSAGNASGTAEHSAAATAVSTSVAPPAGPGSDLDSLLVDFQKQTANNAALNALGKMVHAVHEQIKPNTEYIARKAEEEFKAQHQKDMGETISFVKKEVSSLANHPDAVVEAFLHKYAADHPEANEAWQKRGNSPDAWNTHKVKAKDFISEMVKQIPVSTETVRVTNDVERAAAAVRNVSTDPPQATKLTPQQMVRMSERDWEDYKRGIWAAQQ